MELNDKLLTEIADIFRKVRYGKITFILSPERDTLQCLVEESHKLQINDEKLQKTA